MTQPREGAARAGERAAGALADANARVQAALAVGADPRADVPASARWGACLICHMHILVRGEIYDTVALALRDGAPASQVMAERLRAARAVARLPRVELPEFEMGVAAEEESRG